MKGMKTIILLIFTMAFIAISMNVASAAVNVYVNATMPYDVLYQGDMVSANITVKNNENFPVRIYSVGVHYDWMPTNVVSSVDFGGNYLQVESNGVASPGQLLIHCDNNVTTGYHSFFYTVVLTWYNAYTAAWVNETVVQPGTIFVESPFKPDALQQLQFANKSLSDARAANYSSKRALAEVDNATISLNDGWSAYNGNDYQRAVNDSNDAISYLADAKVSESNFMDKKSSIEQKVISVNDKLKSVAGTVDPDTKKLVDAANRNLNLTKQSLDAEDFDSAQTYVNLADSSADNAINQQYYFNLKSNQTDSAKGIAQSAIDAAQSNIDNASNMTSTAAAGLLTDARLKLSEATDFFNNGDYSNATIKANVVSTLVSQANSDEASYRMMLAHNKIISAGDLKSQDARDLLANASLEYNRSASDFIASNYTGSAMHATLSYNYANDSMAAEQKWLNNNPLSAVSPGFELLAALLALGAIFIIKERKG